MNQETTENESQIIKSGVWLVFRRMLLRDENALIDKWVWCVHCKQTVPYYSNTTNRQLQHQKNCPKKPFTEGGGESNITFKLNELNQLRDSAAKYVVSDVRPISAIAGEGLIQLIYSAIQLGWRYPHMNIADLKNALPSRNSLIPRVKELAENGLKLLGRKIHDAINVSGKFAATTDMWTELNNSTLTMALTFHFFTVEEAGIKLVLR